MISDKAELEVISLEERDGLYPEEEKALQASSLQSAQFPANFSHYACVGEGIGLHKVLCHGYFCEIKYV